MRVVGTDTSYYQYYVKEPNVRIEELDKKGKIQGYLVMNMLSNKIFAVSKTGNAEAFGITLEPAGGSKSPTMEQLYTLGAV